MKKNKRPKLDPERRQHWVNDDFRRTFKVSNERDTGRESWKYLGWELQEKIDKWAQKYPEDVAITGIDDTSFTSSDVVMVLHRVGKRVWGTTVYVVTQCDGQTPIEFFMYPNHRAQLQEALEAMSKFRPWDKMHAMMAKLRRDNHRPNPHFKKRRGK
jgi:hypothetical protein